MIELEDGVADLDPIAVEQPTAAILDAIVDGNVAEAFRLSPENCDAPGNSLNTPDAGNSRSPHAGESQREIFGVLRRHHH